MPDYAKLYRILFNSQTDAIALLRAAQREAEEMYISAPDPDIRVLEPDEKPKEADHEDTD